MSRNTMSFALPESLRNLIADGLASGDGRVVTDDVIAALRTQALGTDA